MKTSDALWLLAFVSFVLGDLVTTAIGLELGLIERAPLYSGRFAGLSLLPVAFSVKIVFVAIALAAFEWLPSPGNLGIPTGLAIVGVSVTAWNSYLILLVA